MVLFALIPSLCLPKEKIDVLASIYPEGRTADCWFNMRLPSDDPRVNSVLRQLSSWELVPWADHFRPRNENCEYRFWHQRVYEDADLAEVLYLELHPPIEAHVHDSPRRTDGLLRLLQGYLNEQFDFATTDFPIGYIMPDRVRRTLDRSFLVGLRCRPTLLLPGTYATADVEPIPWDRHGDPWSELDSDFTMPPLSDSMTFTDKDGKTLKERDFSNGFHRREGLYLHPELHYRAADLEKLEAFDLARTFEPFGNRKGYDRLDCPLIASNRFYQFCVEHGLKTGWVPVRIDPA